MVESINKTVSLKKQAIDKLSWVLATIEWIQERVNSIIELSENLWIETQLDIENLKNIVNNKSIPEKVRRDIWEILKIHDSSTKFNIEQLLKKHNILYTNIENRMKLLFEKISNFFDSFTIDENTNNNNGNISDILKKLFVTCLSIETVILYKNETENIPNKLDIEKYKSELQKINSQLNDIEIRVNKFKKFFDKLPDDTPDDVISKLVNCLVNGESLDNLEFLLNEIWAIEEIVLESKEEKKEQAKKEIESKPRIRRVVKDKVAPNKIIKKNEPSKLNIIFLAIKKYWVFWVSFKEARNKAREELLNKE